MKILLFLNFIYIMFAATTFACEEIDIRDKLSPELKEYFSTPKDQTNAGICWAYTLADIYTVATGKPISATDIAIKVMASAERVGKNSAKASKGDINKLWLPKTGTGSLMNGGFGFDPDSADFVLRGSNQKICEIKSIPDYIGWLSQNGMKDKFYELEKIRRAYNSGDDISDYLPEDCKIGMHDQLGNLSQGEIFETIAEMHDQLLIKSLQTLFEKACKHKVDLPNINMEWGNTKSKSANKFIDSYLSMGRPVGVAMLAKEFMWNQNETGEHVLSIIGKKKINGQCFYIMRNSWGYGCAGYNEKYRINCNPKEGNFYLPVSRLNKVSHIFSYHNLEE